MKFIFSSDKAEQNAYDISYENCSIQFSDYNGISLENIAIRPCDTFPSTIPKTNFVPFTKTTWNLDMGGYNISGGHCCYVEGIEPCHNSDPSFTKVGKTQIYTDPLEIEHSYNICGIESDKPFVSDNDTNQLTNQAMSLDTTNTTTFIVLIISIFISVLLYAVFVVGPFLFWIKYAPRMNYEKGCHAGKTILERHYCRDENELPYNWELLSGCTKPPTQVLPSLDKCPPEHSMYSDNPLGKVGGEGLWDKIVNHIGGFPYYGINKDRENTYKNYDGNLFIVSLLCLGVIFSLAYAPYMNVKNQLGAKIGCGFGLPILLIIIPFVLSGIFKIKTTSFFNKFHLGIVGLSITGYIVNVLIDISNILHSIIPILITFGFFILLWHMSKYKNELGKNLGFMEALMKGGYYIRKSYINSIKYSLMGGRGTAQWWFKTIGEWPIPDWIYVIFGKIVAPILVTFVFICRGLVSFWDAVRGLFGHLKTIKYRQKLKDEEKQLGGAKSIKETISDMGRNAKKGIADRYKLAKDSSKKTIADTVDEYNAGAYTYFKRFETGWSGLLLFPIGFIFSLFMSMINWLFFFFSYHLIPLTYPSIIMNIISCNIHKLGFLFGIGVIALCWTLVNKDESPLPKEVIIGMTITFAVLVIYNLFTKK